VNCKQTKKRPPLGKNNNDLTRGGEKRKSKKFIQNNGRKGNLGKTLPAKQYTFL
jgi:hypothetical protein